MLRIDEGRTQAFVVFFYGIHKSFSQRNLKALMQNTFRKFSHIRSVGASSKTVVTTTTATKQQKQRKKERNKQTNKRQQQQRRRRRRHRGLQDFLHGIRKN